VFSIQVHGKIEEEVEEEEEEEEEAAKSILPDFQSSSFQLP
jgi:hypothetical protein